MVLNIINYCMARATFGEIVYLICCFASQNPALLDCCSGPYAFEWNTNKCMFARKKEQDQKNKNEWQKGRVSWTEVNILKGSGNHESAYSNQNWAVTCTYNNGTHAKLPVHLQSLANGQSFIFTGELGKYSQNHQKSILYMFYGGQVRLTYPKHLL